MSNSKDLQKYIADLSSNSKAIELVASMNPLDVIRAMQKHLDLKPKEATYLYANLLKNSMRESFGTLAINTNMQYPTPNKKETNPNQTPELEEDTSGLPIYVFNNWEFPPRPTPDAQGWPYDANTTKLMDPHNKKRRSLTTSLQHSDGSPSRKGNMEPGQGTFQSTQLASGDGSMAGSGAGITTQGAAGWSKSPPGKEFDMPEGLDDKNMYTTQPNPKGGLSKSVAVFFGGRNPDRNMGFRKK